MRSVRNRLAGPTALKGAIAALPLLLALAAGAPAGMAQTGGSGAGGAGGAAGTGGASPGGTGGGAGPAPSSPGIAPPSPGGAVIGPALTPGAGPGASTTGPQSRPASPPSTQQDTGVPSGNTGIRPVPSAGNAEPNSPIHRQNKDSEGRIVPDVTSPGRAGETSPEDAIPGGSGGGGTGSPAAEAGTDPLDATQTRRSGSISEEPERIRRGGAAGANLDECMQIWDPSTHMTKEQWRTTCERLGR